ncbi:MAG: hypothetical protein ABSA71_17330 [Desulfomonilia bacterium]|jgi:hypothetical protein
MKQGRQLRQKPDLSAMKRNWEAPYVVRRQKELDKFSGGILNARTLANLDSKGLGPKGRVKIGKKVAYPTLSLVAWMEERGEACGTDVYFRQI